MYYEAFENNQNFYITNVYGKNIAMDMSDLRSKIRSYAGQNNGKLWILMGDFNMIKNMEEKLRGIGRDNSDRENSVQCCNDMCMEDIRYYSPFFYLVH